MSRRILLLGGVGAVLAAAIVAVVLILSGGSSGPHTQPPALTAGHAGCPGLYPGRVGCSPPLPEPGVLPSISGTLTVGLQLTATHGTWVSTGDQAPYPITGYAYQWQRCTDSLATSCANVGTNATTYTTVSGDSGSFMRVLVTATNVNGSATQPSLTTDQITIPPPVNVVLPTITGTTVQGDTLTAHTIQADWTNSPTSFSYDWQRCNPGCVSVGATDQDTYVLGVSDVGAKMAVAVTASNAYGASTPAVSNQTATVTATPPGPYAFGDMAVGSTPNGGLTADQKRVNTVTPAQTGDVTTMSIWLSSTTNTSTSTPIRALMYADSAGAPAALMAVSDEVVFTNGQPAAWYTFTFPDSPHVVSGTPYWIGFMNGGGVAAQYNYDSVANARHYNTNAYTAGPTDPFGTASLGSEQISMYATEATSGSPVNSVAPPVPSGTTTVGQVLTATGGTWTNSPTLSYQWQDCSTANMCSNITGATGTQYTLASGDQGSTVRVVVTGTNASGFTKAASGQTTAVTGTVSGNLTWYADANHNWDAQFNEATMQGHCPTHMPSSMTSLDASRWDMQTAIHPPGLTRAFKFVLFDGDSCYSTERGEVATVLPSVEPTSDWDSNGCPLAGYGWTSPLTGKQSWFCRGGGYNNTGEYWIAMWFYIPTGSALGPGPQFHAIYQMHNPGNGGPPFSIAAYDTGGSTSTPVQMTISRSACQTVACSSGNVYWTYSPIPRDTWVRFLIDMKLSDCSNGYQHTWSDLGTATGSSWSTGTPIASYNGWTLKTTTGACGGYPYPLDAQQGNYRNASYTGTSTVYENGPYVGTTKSAVTSAAFGF